MENHSSRLHHATRMKTAILRQFHTKKYGKSDWRLVKIPYIALQAGEPEGRYLCPF